MRLSSIHTGSAYHRRSSSPSADMTGTGWRAHLPEAVPPGINLLAATRTGRPEDSLLVGSIGMAVIGSLLLAHVPTPGLTFEAASIEPSVGSGAGRRGGGSGGLKIDAARADMPSVSIGTLLP
jgi:hypothetical protein